MNKMVIGLYYKQQTKGLGMNYIYDIYNGTGANVCPSCTGGESARMGSRYAVRVADSVGGVCSKCGQNEEGN